MITQDELDELPIHGAFRYEAVPLPDNRYPEAKGDFINIPIHTVYKVLEMEDDDYICVIDRQGNIWSTGYINGERFKQRTLE